MVPVEEPYNSEDADVAGIKIELSCRTPYQGGTATATEFINKRFLDVLREKGREPGTGFYFDRVYLFDGHQVDSGSSGFGTPTARFGASGGRGFGGTSGGGAAGLRNAGDFDPITDEPVAADWKFEIWIDAILGEVPEELLAEGAEDRAEEG